MATAADHLIKCSPGVLPDSNHAGEAWTVLRPHNFFIQGMAPSSSPQ